MRNPIVIGGSMTGLGGLLIVLGSFLPWLTATAPFAGTITVNGMQGDGIGDGVITLVLGMVTILIGVAQLTRNLPARWQLLPIATGILTGLIAVSAYSSVQDRIDRVTAESNLVAASVGPGIWTLFVGAAFAIAGGLFARRGTNEQANGGRPGAVGPDQLPEERPGPAGSPEHNHDDGT